MDFQKLKDNIYYCDGSLRDIYILHTDIDDNRKWAEFVNENYTIKWFNGLRQENESKIDFEVVRGYLNGDHDLCSSASIFLDKVQINNHFFVDTEIENDISPKEIKSIDDHNKLIAYMTGLSKALGKRVILTPEGEANIAFITVDKDEIKINI